MYHAIVPWNLTLCTAAMFMVYKVLCVPRRGRGGRARRLVSG